MWHTSLDRAADDTRQAALLDEDERARSNMYRFDRDRKRFIAGRSFLRAVLEDYISVRPGDIVFRIAKLGKPSVDSKCGLEFSFSRSDGRAVCAIVLGQPVGADIERLRVVPDAMQIAKQFFSSDESAALARLDATHTDAAFLSCWTRKEAIVKAVGAGLYAPLDTFSVSVLPAEPGILSHCGGERTQRWTLANIRTAPGYVGAAAVQRTGMRIVERCWGEAS